MVWSPTVFRGDFTPRTKRISRDRQTVRTNTTKTTGGQMDSFGSNSLLLADNDPPRQSIGRGNSSDWCDWRWFKRRHNLVAITAATIYWGKSESSILVILFRRSDLGGNFKSLATSTNSRYVPIQRTRSDLNCLRGCDDRYRFTVLAISRPQTTPIAYLSC